MEDLFKKFINAGVGFVSLTNDRVQTTIDKLVKDSKLSEQEGQKIKDDLKKNTDTKRKELEAQITGIANRLMKSVGVASNADVEELKRSVRGTKTAATSGGSTAAGSKSGSKAASSTTAKAAGATKKTADKVSGAAGTAQKSASAKAGAAKPASKSTAKKEAPKSADNGSDASSAS